jgi:hypothetical protein
LSECRRKVNKIERWNGKNVAEDALLPVLGRKMASGATFRGGWPKLGWLISVLAWGGGCDAWERKSTACSLV